MENPPTQEKGLCSILRVAPGLRNLFEYRRRNGCGTTRWRAYRSLRWLCRRPSRMRSFIGFDPVVGLYAAILPLVAYAVFGTSRHLIINPDAATCAMVGATLMPRGRCGRYGEEIEEGQEWIVDAHSQRLLWVGQLRKIANLGQSTCRRWARPCVNCTNATPSPRPVCRKRIKVRVLSWLPIEDLL